MSRSSCDMQQEGTGPAVMSAFVEVIFDNSDERFPTGKPELILRRTIGIKKDEYSLDRKNATKSDVMNLLESAGFSRSNPYYIVPQGRVTALTNMKDAERLTILKEVAGTQVYEARRAESLKIMTDTNNKRIKIDELLEYINERLGELEEEKEELRDYQEKDKERRCLQYTIDHREQLAIANELDNLEELRQNGVEDTDDSRERFIQGEKELAETDSRMNRLKQEMELFRMEKRQLEAERGSTDKEKAKIEHDLKTLQDNESTAQNARAQYDKELKTLNASIHEREGELTKIAPKFAAIQAEETGIKGELDNAEATRQRLYAKQGRNARFKNKKERDDWLRREIDEGYPQLAKIKAVRLQTLDEIKELEGKITATESSITGLKDQLDSRGNDTSNMQEQLQAIRADKAEKDDQRK